MTYARTQIAVHNVFAEGRPGWNSNVNRWLGIGGNYRGGFRDVDVPGSSGSSDWLATKSTLYIELRPLADLFTIYVDEQVSPGGSRI